jgi:large subunit ribosomal protein L17
MRHRHTGRYLNRNTNQRQALYSGLTTQLIQHESLTTSLAKAKAVKPLIEKLLTRAKTKTVASHRHVASVIKNSSAVTKLFDQLAPRYLNRPGGYLRITPLGTRPGDQSPRARIEFIPTTALPLGKTPSPAPAKAKPQTKPKPPAKTQRSPKKQSQSKAQPAPKKNKTKT